MPRMILLSTVFIATFGGGSGFAADTPPDEPIHRYYWVQGEVTSWRPDEPLASFRRHGSEGGCSLGGTYGTGVKTARQAFEISISCVRDPKRFLVKVKVASSDAATKSFERQFDLTDLNTESLELDRDEDGRIYRLSLVPEIKEAFPPKVFDPDSLAPRSWNFQSSPVILNDQTYVGQIGMSGGTLVGVSIAGIAECEFSLVPLKDAKPTGVLHDGVVRLQGDDLSIMISNVRNGSDPQILKGGPYKVWVRWSEPEISADAAKQIIRSQIELLEIRAGDGSGISPDDLRRLKEFADTGKPMLLGSSGRDVRPDELATPESPVRPK